MSLVSTLKTITIAEISKIKELVDKAPPLQLSSAVQSACQEWRHAQKEMDHIDGDLAEYVIFKINAAERRYIALLEQARKEGITAWPDADFHPVQAVYEGSCSVEVKNAPAL